MNEIIDYDRNSLIDLLNHADTAIKDQYDLIKDFDKLCLKYIQCNNEKTKAVQHSPIIITITILFLSPILLFIYFYMNVLFLKNYKSLLIIFALLYILIILLIPIIHFCSKRSLNKTSDKYCSEINRQYQTILNLRNECFALQIIPFRYQTPAALQEIIQYLTNYRANNWTEAVNILEETIHRNNMIYLQSKQLSSLNQQLTLLSDIKKNAGTSGLDVVIALAGLFT